MVKTDVIANDIIALLEVDKENGKSFVEYSARDFKDILNIDGRFGTNRYPMICSAMDKALQTVPGVQVSGVNPSSTYTVKFDLQ